jgi:hypothetical protein
VPPVLVELMRVLARAGFRIDLQAVHFDSYFAVVRDDSGEAVGNIEYRSPLDEAEEYARGLSYASLLPEALARIDQAYLLFKALQ